jgi:peptidyl-dipeptidase Dcp
MRCQPILLACTIVACALLAPAQADSTMTGSDNPLLAEWDTPFGVPPFDAIGSDDYLPAFREAMQRHRAEIEAIAASTERATFANTIEALERAGADLQRVSNVFHAVEAANTDDTLRETNRVISPELARHSDAIVLDPRLYERVKAVYDQRDGLDLTGEQARLLEETHKRFVRSGAALDDAAQDRLREINAELASLGQQFGDNLLEETNAFELHVTDEADLGNLPGSLRGAAAAEAKRRGYDEGWVFTLQRPSCNPFLEYSPNREMRRKVFEGYAMRANRGNEHDNNPLLTRMAELRAERARLLGHPTHAHYVLSDNMAETPDRVLDLLDQVWEPALRVAKEERAALQEMMQADGIDDRLRGWDWRYYANEVRKARFDLDEEETRPYFEFTAVRDGCFAVAEKLFGIRLVELEDMPKWHPHQQVFEVVEADGTHIGVIYLDFFARESKSGGAWMNELVMQQKLTGDVSPIVTNNFNFPPPTEDGPSLLSFSESKTLFHEFGHGLHGLLSDVTYASLSGTNVPRDFVEFPSQVMENWFGEPETLRMFARHYETGEPIPDALIEKIRAAANFNQGFATAEYLAASYLDLAWHTLEHGSAKIADPVAFEQAEMDRIGLIDEIIPRYRNTYFAHVFAGGYSSGYYSYLWSEVLDADAFTAFAEGDLFDREMAGRFRTLLSRGGTAPGMELYVEFRGREPEIRPLLERRGLVGSSR